MSIKAYINALRRLQNKHGDIPVVYSDEAGESFHKIEIEPSAGRLLNGVFHAEGELSGEDLKKSKRVICVN